MKQRYSPVPLRAYRDFRLKERHLRVIGVVAAHDRLGKNGNGCTASHQRIASLSGCHYTRLSATLGDLERWGYLTVERHQKDGRKRIYRVVYTDGDVLIVEPSDEEEGLPVSKQSCPAKSPDTSPTGKLSDGEIVSPQGNNPQKDVSAQANNPIEIVSTDSEIVNMDFCQAFDVAGENDPLIYSVETEGIDSAEADLIHPAKAGLARSPSRRFPSGHHPSGAHKQDHDSGMLTFDEAEEILTQAEDQRAAGHGVPSSTIPKLKAIASNSGHLGIFIRQRARQLLEDLAHPPSTRLQ